MPSTKHKSPTAKSVRRKPVSRKVGKIGPSKAGSRESHPGKPGPGKPGPRKPARTATVPYDVASQLRSPSEMAAYLEAWLVEAPDDTAGIARALGDIARAHGMSKVAKHSGLSRESLYKSLSEDGNPSFATILKVAKAVGVRLHASAG